MVLTLYRFYWKVLQVLNTLETQSVTEQLKMD